MCGNNGVISCRGSNTRRNQKPLPLPLVLPLKKDLLGRQQSCQVHAIELLQFSLGRIMSHGENSCSTSSVSTHAKNAFAVSVTFGKNICRATCCCSTVTTGSEHRRLVFRKSATPNQGKQANTTPCYLSALVSVRWRATKLLYEVLTAFSWL